MLYMNTDGILTEISKCHVTIQYCQQSKRTCESIHSLLLAVILNTSCVLFTYKPQEPFSFSQVLKYFLVH